MRQLWQGDVVTARTEHYTVEGARIYEQPTEPIPILVSGFGPKAIQLAARLADGYVTVQPDATALSRYREAGGRGPAVGALKVCFGPDRDDAVQLAYRKWRTESLPGELNQILPSPAHFAQASQLVAEEQVASSIPCGSDPEPYVQAIQRYLDAGFDEIYLTQIGEDVAGFLSFFERQVRPGLTLDSQAA
jgi:G6PDH family F420-dependent oxidoreductase